MGVNFSLGKLPYQIKLGAGGYASAFNDLRDWHFPIKIAKKALLSEEDAIDFNMALSLHQQYYVGYTPYLHPVLGRFSGLSLAYKTGSKENVLNSAKFTCSTHIHSVRNPKPVAKIDFTLNGRAVADLGIFSSLYNMLPEKSKELCGRLDSMTLNVTHHFHKNRNSNNDAPQDLAGKFEHVTLSCVCNFKDIFQTKGSEVKLGFGVKPLKPEHERAFGIIFTLSKKFALI